jgi:hypothetical protein
MDEPHRIRGPWSSRSEVANGLGFTPSMEVSITDDHIVYKRGYTFVAGHITMALWETYLESVGRVISMLDVSSGVLDAYGVKIPGLKIPGDGTFDDQLAKLSRVGVADRDTEKQGGLTHDD